MEYSLKQPCKECPFRRVSLRGWLGPWKSPEELHHFVHGDGALACHLTVTPAREFNENAPGVKFCAGAAIYMNNTCKRSRDKDVASYQDALGTSAAVLDWDFREHHGKEKV